PTSDEEQRWRSIYSGVWNTIVQIEPIEESGSPRASKSLESQGICLESPDVRAMKLNPFVACLCPCGRQRCTGTPILDLLNKVSRRDLTWSTKGPCSGRILGCSNANRMNFFGPA